VNAIRPAALVGLTVAIALVTGALAQSSASFSLKKSAIAGGGGRATSAGRSLHGTIGQPAAGVSGGPGIRLSAGFWSPVRLGGATSTPTPGGQASPTGPPTDTAMPTTTTATAPPSTATVTATAGPSVSATPGGQASPTGSQPATATPSVPAATVTATSSGATAPPQSSPTAAPSATAGPTSHIWLPLAARRWTMAAP
jgi:hypothetical protein